MPYNDHVFSKIIRDYILICIYIFVSSQKISEPLTLKLNEKNSKVSLSKLGSGSFRYMRQKPDKSNRRRFDKRVRKRERDEGRPSADARRLLALYEQQLEPVRSYKLHRRVVRIFLRRALGIQRRAGCQAQCRHVDDLRFSCEIRKTGRCDPPRRCHMGED